MVELALCGQLLLWMLMLALLLVIGRPSIFHPLTVYLAFHAVVFVLRPWVVYYLHFDTIWNYMVFEPTERDFLMTLAVSSVALVTFSAACLLFGRAESGFQSVTPQPFTVAQQRALVLTTVLLLPLALYSIRSLMSGGLQGEHRGGTFVLTGASGYTLEAQFMVGPLLCAWLAITRFKWSAFVPVIGYIAYRSYTGWNRWTIVLLFFAVAVIYAWQKRKRWLPMWSVLLIIPIFFLFQTLGRNRDYFRQVVSGEPVQETQEVLSKRDELKSKYDTQEFANFDFLCFVIAMVPEKTGTYTYGGQYLQLFTEPIPRKLWAGKPAGAPVQLFNLNAYGNFLGLTPSLAGDGWMSGGWVGLLVTMTVAGALAGLGHRWFWRRGDENMPALFYLIALAMLPQWFRDGGISIAKFLFWNWLPLIVWVGVTWLCGGRLVRGHSIGLPRGVRLRVIQGGRVSGRESQIEGPISCET